MHWLRLRDYVVRRGCCPSLHGGDARCWRSAPSLIAVSRVCWGSENPPAQRLSTAGSAMLCFCWAGGCLDSWDTYHGCCGAGASAFAGLAGRVLLLACVLLVLQYLVGAVLHEQCRDSCLLAAGLCAWLAHRPPHSRGPLPKSGSPWFPSPLTTRVTSG